MSRPHVPGNGGRILLTRRALVKGGCASLAGAAGVLSLPRRASGCPEAPRWRTLLLSSKDGPPEQVCSALVIGLGLGTFAALDALLAGGLPSVDVNELASHEDRRVSYSGCIVLLWDDSVLSAPSDCMPRLLEARRTGSTLVGVTNGSLGGECERSAVRAIGPFPRFLVPDFRDAVEALATPWLRRTSYLGCCSSELMEFLAHDRVGKVARWPLGSGEHWRFSPEDILRLCAPPLPGFEHRGVYVGLYADGFDPAFKLQSVNDWCAELYEHVDPDSDIVLTEHPDSQGPPYALACGSFAPGTQRPA